jgi:hypothetical protein
MSFILVLVLLAVVAIAVLALVRHDAPVPPRAESHHRPPPDA